MTEPNKKQKEILESIEGRLNIMCNLAICLAYKCKNDDALEVAMLNGALSVNDCTKRFKGKISEKEFAATMEYAALMASSLAELTEEEHGEIIVKFRELSMKNKLKGV